MSSHHDQNTSEVSKESVKLEDLKVLRRSPDLLNNVKIGQGQLQLIMEQILFLPYKFWSSDLNNLMNPGHRSAWHSIVSIGLTIMNSAQL